MEFGSNKKLEDVEDILCYEVDEKFYSENHTFCGIVCEILLKIRNFSTIFNCLYLFNLAELKRNDRAKSEPIIKIYLSKTHPVYIINYISIVYIRDSQF